MTKFMESYVKSELSVMTESELLDHMITLREVIEYSKTLKNPYPTHFFKEKLLIAETEYLSR